MDYQIIHAIEGRLRLRISLLSTDAVFAGKLQQLVEAIAPVTSVRINAQAQSIIITYKNKKISQPALLEAIEGIIAQVAPPPEEPSETPLETADPAEAANPPEATIEVPPAISDLQSVASEASDSVKATVSNPTASNSTASNPIASNPTAIDLEEDPWADQPSILLADAKAGEMERETVALQSPIVGIAPEESAASDASDISGETPVEMPLEFPRAITALPPLSSQALATRLGVTVQALNRYRSKPDFSEWCRSKDPNDTGWQFEEASKRFNPVTSEPIDSITIHSEGDPAQAIDADILLQNTAAESAIESSEPGEINLQAANSQEVDLQEIDPQAINGNHSNSKSKKLRNPRSKGAKKGFRAS